MGLPRYRRFNIYRGNLKTCVYFYFCCSLVSCMQRDTLEESLFRKEPIRSTLTEKLEALEERPVLPLKSGFLECYRFTWLRTSEHPVVLRIDVLKDGTAYFHQKIADGRGGYNPGKLFRDEKWKLTGSSLESFKKTFSEAAFFDQTVSEEMAGMDGSTWLIEAVINGRYHAIERWSPHTGAAWTIGTAFIKIAVDDFSRIY
jgi:hypothetical protein